MYFSRQQEQDGNKGATKTIQFSPNGEIMGRAPRKTKQRFR
jgi:hypothetical protein